MSVRDTGIGIPTEDQHRVFELFTRVHPKRHSKTSGLGIGLALARQLVELHCGRLEVRSDGADTGSEFIVTLPLSAASAPAVTADTGVSPSNGRAGALRRILVVDDNRDAAESFAMLLQLNGSVTRIAANRTDAMTLLEAFRPEMVFLDIGLPDFDGYEVARRVRASAWGSQVRLVALTGWGQADDKRHAAEAGFDNHLTKPVDPASLDAILSAGM